MKTFLCTRWRTLPLAASLAMLLGAASVAPAFAAASSCSSNNCQPGDGIVVNVSASALTVRAGEKVTFTASASDMDKCGDPDDCPDTIASYTWDGASGTGNTATQTFYYTPGATNTYTVTCTANDTGVPANDPTDGSGSVTITVIDPTQDPNNPDHGKTPDDQNSQATNNGGSGGNNGGPCDECDRALFSPSFGDPVILATRQERYTPGPDIVVYNPYGSPVSFQREYFTGAAKQGYGSPGLPAGWLSDYDTVLVPVDSTHLRLLYPNGASELLKSALLGSTAILQRVDTNDTALPGAPYAVTVQPSATTGPWTSVTITDKQGVQSAFSILDGRYRLQKRVDTYGNTVLFDRDVADRISLIKAAKDTGLTSFQPLLQFTYADYDGGSYLSEVRDVSTASASDNRRVVYGYAENDPYNPDPAQNRLATVSQVQAPDANSPTGWTQSGDRYTFGYETINNRPHLSSITVPTQAGTSTASIHYNTDATVRALEDGNHNLHIYTNQGVGGDGFGRTLVQVYAAQDATHSVDLNNPDPTKLVDSWTSKYNADGYDAGIERQHSTLGPISTRIEYDTVQKSHPVDMYDEKGRHAAHYVYDSYGNVTSVTDIRGTITALRYEYPAGLPGRVYQKTVGSKAPVNYTYASANSYALASVSTVSPANPAQQVTRQYTYVTTTVPPFGNVSQVTGPGHDSMDANVPNQLYATYDYGTAPKFGRPTTVTNNLSQPTTYHYDGRSRPDSVTDAQTNVTAFSYNIADQLEWITYPETQTGAGHATHQNVYLYPGGPRTGETDYNESNQALRSASYSYGPEGELLSRTSTGGDVEPVTYTYDALYRVTAVTDGKGKTTYRDYNSDGDLTKVHYPLADSKYPHFDVTEFGGFDATGHPAWRKDGNRDANNNPIQTNYTYDSVDDALKTVGYPDGTSVQYSYINPSTNTRDPYGRRRQMTDSTGQTTYAYDDLDNLTTVTTAFQDSGSTLFTSQLSYTYWPDGRRASMNSPKGLFQYKYDGAGRPNWLQNPLNEVSTWSYTNNGWPQTQALSNSAGAAVATTTYSYDGRGFLTRLLNQAGTAGPTISDFTGPIQHDALGNMTAMTVANSANYNGTTTFQYAPTAQAHPYGQLWSETSNRNAGASKTYAYDPAFNPTSMRGVAKSANDDNQLNGSESYDYDGNGNPTTFRGAPFVYDYENRFVSYTPSGTTPFFEERFNGDGLRAWKRINGTTRTFYLYDQDEELVCELNSAGTVTALSTFGADGLLSRWTSAGGSTFYVFDPQGNTAQRLDGSGAVLSADLYDAFGNRIATTAASSDVYGYGAQWGYYTDTEMGLLLLTHRTYDPVAGRFLTRDPTGFAGGTNLYAFVQNDPVNFGDPWGLAKKPHGAGFWGAVATGAAAVGGFIGGAIEKAATGEATVIGKVAGATVGLVAAGIGAYSDYCTYRKAANDASKNKWNGNNRAGDSNNRLLNDMRQGNHIDTNKYNPITGEPW